MSDCGNVYLIGCGGHAKVVLHALLELGYTVSAVFDDNQALWGTAWHAIPVVGPLEKLADSPALPTVIAIGDNAARRALAERFDRYWLTVVDPRAVVDSTARVGRGTVVLRGAVIQADARLGDHVIVNTSASIDHDCMVEDYAHVAPGAHLAGSVRVGTGAFLGIGVATIPGVAIGAWTTVGAGGTVARDLPAGVIAVGVPARVTRFKRSDGDGNGERDDSAVSSSFRDRPSATAASTATASAATANENGKPAAERSRVYLSPPHMSGLERELLLEAFDSNWIAPLGPQVDAFEREFAERLGVAEAVALSSGTAALHLSLLLLGIERGDEVLTSSLTFAATANAITYVGATPVFIDSNRETWNMDPDLLAEELEIRTRQGKRPKAVLAVDIYGQCADYEAILKTCRFYEIPIIEDAAEALGASWRGRAAGTFGAVGCFSFNGNKIITSSGGGMLVTGRREWAQRARFLATQARDPGPHYEHSVVGYNYRMSNLLAAVGRGQLRVLDNRVLRRRSNYEFYRDALAGLPGIDFMPEPAAARSTRWLSCITVDPQAFPADREAIRLALEQENIESRPVWKPMHLQPAFAGCRVRGGEVSAELFRTGLCLPSGSSLSAEDRWRVVRTIYGVAGRAIPTELHAEPLAAR